MKELLYREVHDPSKDWTFDYDKNTFSVPIDCWKPENVLVHFAVGATTIVIGDGTPINVPSWHVAIVVKSLGEIQGILIVPDDVINEYCPGTYMEIRPDEELALMEGHILLNESES